MVTDTSHVIDLTGISSYPTRNIGNKYILTRKSSSQLNKTQSDTHLSCFFLLLKYQRLRFGSEAMCGKDSHPAVDNNDEDGYFHKISQAGHSLPALDRCSSKR